MSLRRRNKTCFRKHFHFPSKRRLNFIATKMNRTDLIRLNSVLNLFTDNNVKLRQDERTEALEFCKPKVEKIVDYVKTVDVRFAEISIFPTGSYYERTKVGKPDEFDLMLVMDNLELDDDPYGEDDDDGMSDPPIGFTRVMIDMGEEVQWQQDNCVNYRGMLNASRVKSVFSRLVRNAISNLGYGRNRMFKVAVESHGPAVTLQIINYTNEKEYSVDLVLAIRDTSWPDEAKEWRTRPRKGWPNAQLVQGILQDGCYLVAKQPKQANIKVEEQGFLWLFSFSAAEKKLALQGGHGQPNSCRKQVLRILKALKEELGLHPLKSYHLKTMLLYECEANPHPTDWSSDRLSERFIGLLQRLEGCLVQRNCPHYFIKNFNLFAAFAPQRCSELATNIQNIKQKPEWYLNKLIQQSQQ